MMLMRLWRGSALVFVDSCNILQPGFKKNDSFTNQTRNITSLAEITSNKTPVHFTILLLTRWIVSACEPNVCLACSAVHTWRCYMSDDAALLQRNATSHQAQVLVWWLGGGGRINPSKGLLTWNMINLVHTVAEWKNKERNCDIISIVQKATILDPWQHKQVLQTIVSFHCKSYF